MNISLRRGESPTSATVQIGSLSLLFSYDTIVAFSLDHHWYASENVWSKTTGKHLNEVSDKRDRIPHEVFTKALEKALDAISPVSAAAAVGIDRIIHDGVR